MHHLLPPFLSNIELESISGDLQFLPKVPGKEEKSSDGVLVRIAHMCDALDVFFGDKEHVDTRFRMDIVDDDVVCILIHGNRRNLVGGNGTENAHKNKGRKYLYQESI